MDEGIVLIIQEVTVKLYTPFTLLNYLITKLHNHNLQRDICCGTLINSKAKEYYKQDCVMSIITWVTGIIYLFAHSTHDIHRNIYKNKYKNQAKKNKMPQN